MATEPSRIRRARSLVSFRPKLESLEDRVVPSYTITDLGTLGGTFSSADALSGKNVAGNSANATGQDDAFLYTNGGMVDLGTLGGHASYALGVYGSRVVGYSNTAGDATTHAFLDRQGKMIDLGTLGGSTSSATAIGSAGIVGFSTLVDGSTNAFIFRNGAMTDLGTLGGGFSKAWAINTNSEIVGRSSLPGGVEYHATSWNNGTITDLGTLGGTYSWAYAVNDSGVVAGAATVPGDQKSEPVTYSNGTITQLGDLGGGNGNATGINKFGTVVGWSYTTNDVHAFVYAHGRFADLNTLIPPNSGWDLNEAQAISNSGIIVGTGLNPAGQSDAFLLTPVRSEAENVGGFDPVPQVAAFEARAATTSIPIVVQLSAERAVFARAESDAGLGAGQVHNVRPHAISGTLAHTKSQSSTNVGPIVLQSADPLMDSWEVGW